MGIDHPGVLLERWQSGRLHLTRNQEFLCGNREFESPPFLIRQRSDLVISDSAAGREERSQLRRRLLREHAARDATR